MTNSIPDNPDALLTRSRTAEALTEAGFPVKAKTLATKATRGGGPPFSKFGLRVLYRWRDALAWAQGRLSATYCSTSEKDAAAVNGSLAESESPVMTRNSRSRHPFNWSRSKQARKSNGKVEQYS
jgi:hypothetical protein